MEGGFRGGEVDVAAASYKCVRKALWCVYWCSGTNKNCFLSFETGIQILELEPGEQSPGFRMPIREAGLLFALSLQLHKPCIFQYLL